MNNWFDRMPMRLPLRVVSAMWRDPVLVLRGANWSLSVLSTWRIVLQGKLLVGSDAAEVRDIPPLLDGKLVVACKPHGSLADPSLEFEDGYVLEVFSTCALEPWVLRFESTGEVYIGEPAG